MSHHGWVDVIKPATLAPDGLKAPFGRLFAAEDISYNSLAIALLAGPDGPLEQPVPTGATKPSNPAGFTFLGQFIDHDLTEFRVIGDGFSLIPQNPAIGQRQRVLEDVRDVPRDLPTTTNGRTGKLDLDSIYGLLGAAQPGLYTPDGLFDLKVETHQGNHLPPDIQRGSKFRNARLIADPRNDENKLIVQIHMLFQRLHNTIHGARLAAFTGNPSDKPFLFGPTGPEFKTTKELVQSIYRRIVRHDYLPRIVQPRHIRKVLEAFAAGTTFFQKMNDRNDAILVKLNIADTATEAVAIPVEFSHAVFRLGHTQLRNGYALHATLSARLFDSAAGPDLRGDSALFSVNGANVSNFHVEWARFFRLQNANPVDASGDPTHPQHGEPIDAHLPKSIFRLPPPAIGEPPQSLAERNIRRGIDFGLPTGQSAAGQLAALYGFIEPMSQDELFPPALFDRFNEVLRTEPRLQWDTPLWYYMLREAQKHTGTPQLGSVGGYIVAETILGALLEAEVKEPDLATRPAAIKAAAQAILDETTPGPLDWNEGPGDPRAWDAVVTKADGIISMAQLIAFVKA